MIKISCEGETSLEVLSHIKGFASLIGAEVPTKTGTMPEEIAAQAGAPAPVHTPAAPAVAPVASPPQPAVPIAPPPPPPVPTVAAPAAPAVPTVAAPAAPAAPIAPAPAYDLNQLAVAATSLIDAGRRQEVLTLLQSFGVQALTLLPPAQYGAFATALRGMGAKL